VTSAGVVAVRTLLRDCGLAAWRAARTKQAVLYVYVDSAARAAALRLRGRGSKIPRPASGRRDRTGTTWNHAQIFVVVTTPPRAGHAHAPL
jgi:hypothetical protein